MEEAGAHVTVGDFGEFDEQLLAHELGLVEPARVDQIDCSVGALQREASELEAAAHRSRDAHHEAARRAVRRQALDDRSMAQARPRSGTHLQRHW
jgi:hypothetical protein